MENPRAEKVAVVDEVRERLNDATGSVVTEYRGLTVTQLAELRQRLSAAGGDYKVYKNTLVRLAITSGPHEQLADYLTGPTAIAFVHGDVSAVAKALRDFARTNPALVIKGGLLEGSTLSASELSALADLPSRDVLLARLAGGIAAPLQQLAGLLQALPRNLAYGLSALLDQQGGAPEPVTAAVPDVEVPSAGTEEPAESEPESAATAESPTLEESPAAETAEESPAAETAEESPAAETAEESPAAETAEESSNSTES
jgi:large subunit ribosomal protein L10